MKNIILLIGLTFGLSFTAHAQTVCTVKYPGDADVKIYISSDSASSDLAVYVTTNSAEVSGNT